MAVKKPAKAAKKPAAKRKPRKRPAAGRGRPAFRATPEQRLDVEQMIACGEPKTVIARALGIDVDTLVKHFAEEVANGAAARRREVIGELFKQMRKGNAAAVRKLEEATRIANDTARDGTKDEKAAKPEKLGKKEEQQRQAEGVTGKFAPPAPPRLVASNGIRQ